jgi:cellobiose epimerase
MNSTLVKYKLELEAELESILSYWSTHTMDSSNGGFVGKIDHFNHKDPLAPKGSVLNSRILWSFSAAYRLTGKQQYLEVANRAYEYYIDHFIDNEYGGVYWTIDYKGNPLDTKNQVYALSFAVYALSEYFGCSSNEEAKEYAISLYCKIVEHSYDKNYGGYIEALTRDWKEMDDLRLSGKDANERKSMNTHLHILEGFTNLFRIWPNEVLKQQLHELLQLFLKYIISKENSHLVLFFDDAWRQKSKVISYGHDIEAAWLLQETAELLNNGLLLIQVQNKSVQLVEAAARGLDRDGGLWYEYDPENFHLIREKHSWPQAEAMVGFFHGWQITGLSRYLDQSLKSWHFIRNHIHDPQFGEWYWGVYEDYTPMVKEDKVGVWKCPYHNSRACIELINRITKILDVQTENERMQLKTP